MDRLISMTSPRDFRRQKIVVYSFFPLYYLIYKSNTLEIFRSTCKSFMGIYSSQKKKNSLPTDT